jgi:hypothetical protein
MYEEHQASAHTSDWAYITKIAGGVGRLQALGWGGGVSFGNLVDGKNPVGVRRAWGFC